MSAKIYREVVTKKDLTTHPMKRRYALFCKPSMQEDSGVICESRENNGHLGDYDDSRSVEEAALSHPHPVLIRQKALYQASRYDF